LVYGLAELAPQHDLFFDLPSRLADDLAAGRLDVALIPSIEYLQRPDYAIVSDACIACRGPVRSVKLFSRVPMNSIQTLALDEGSRTSVALVQILLNERFGISPRLTSFPIDARPESIAADALLMIGDRAIQMPPGRFVEQWDLGDIWCRWAELPFVFAMWVARKGSGFRVQGSEEVAELAAILSEARDLGVQRVEEIAKREHQGVGLSYDECLTYLRDHLHFYLGERERQGLALFAEHACRLGLAPKKELMKSGTKFGPGQAKQSAT